MQEENTTPMMYRLWFGEAAGRAQRGAWLGELKQQYSPNAHRQALMAWRRLASQCGKLPWEMGTGEIAQHVEWMQAQGYAAATIDYALDMFAKFFRWCTENQVDPEVATGFNPAAGVPRPKRPRYAGVKLLSRGELGRLLGLQGSKDEEDWAESVLEALRLAAKERGEELDVKAVRAEARGDEPNLGAATRLLVEEIASVRVALRRAFNLAMASQEVGDLVRLTDIYGHGCFRLVKLLKADKGDQGKLEAYLRGGIDQALDEVTKEWGLV